MTVKEFFESRGGYIKLTFDKADERFRNLDLLKGDEWRNSYFLLCTDVYTILGYVNAAFDYGHISVEDKRVFEKELSSMIGL